MTGGTCGACGACGACEACATRFPILLVHGTGFRDWKRLCYWGRVPEALRREGAEVFFGCRTRFKLLRFLPLYCFAVTLIFAVKAWNTPSLFIGLNGLAALIWGLIGVCILLGYGAALLVYKLIG